MEMQQIVQMLQPRQNDNQEKAAKHEELLLARMEAKMEAIQEKAKFEGKM
jgi:hypothetical protein